MSSRSEQLTLPRTTPEPLTDERHFYVAPLPESKYQGVCARCRHVIEHRVHLRPSTTSDFLRRQRVSA